MWKAQVEQIDRQITGTTLTSDSGVLSFSQVIELWRNSCEFRTFFTKLISETPFEAFFWETPSVTNQTINRPFAFVVVESKLLERLIPDSSPFASHFSSRRS